MASQRTGKPPAGPRPAQRQRPGAPVPDASAGSAAVRVTGRGALVGLFVLSFLGLLLSDGLGWGPLAGAAFVMACGLAAASVVPGDLLAVAVSPPALFLAAVICAQALTSPGSLPGSATKGTLIILGNMAPWLITGMALALIITFARGLPDNVRELGEDLRRYRASASASPSRRPGQAA